MDLGIAQNPLLLSQYIEDWATSSRTKAAGFKLLAERKLVCEHCKVQSRSNKHGRVDGWLTPVDISHPAFALLKPENGILLCPPCLAAQALNWSLAGTPQGMLIFAPGLEQSQITRLAALSGVASCFDDPYGVGKQMVAAVESVMHQQAKFLGSSRAFKVSTDGVDQAEMNIEFAQTLSLLNPDTYQNRGQVIRDIRFWPSLQYFSGYYQHLRDHAPAFSLERLQKKISELAASSAPATPKHS